jgi:hypothetical protein
LIWKDASVQSVFHQINTKNGVVEAFFATLDTSIAPVHAFDCLIPKLGCDRTHDGIFSVIDSRDIVIES